MRGISRVELNHSAAQRITFTTGDLAKLNASKSIEMILGPNDSVLASERWKLDDRQIVGSGLRHTFSSSGQTLAIQTPLNWFNPLSSFDVSGNGFVTPLDALLVINYINQRGSGNQMPTFDPLQPLVHGFYDVNGSNSIEPLDVLLVINRLNETSAGEGESKPDNKKRS